MLQRAQRWPSRNLPARGNRGEPGRPKKALKSIDLGGNSLRPRGVLPAKAPMPLNGADNCCHTQRNCARVPKGGPAGAGEYRITDKMSCATNCQRLTLKLPIIKNILFFAAQKRLK